MTTTQTNTNTNTSATTKQSEFVWVIWKEHNYYQGTYHTQVDGPMTRLGSDYRKELITFTTKKEAEAYLQELRDGQEDRRYTLSHGEYAQPTRTVKRMKLSTLKKMNY